MLTVVLFDGCAGMRAKYQTKNPDKIVFTMAMPPTAGNTVP